MDARPIVVEIAMEKNMSLGLIAHKVGMMRLFTAEGEAVPVTVLSVSNNRVTQIKTIASDGYSAVQVACGKRRPSRVTKALKGHVAKAGVNAGQVLREFRVDPEQVAGLSNGAVLGAELFERGQKIEVQGVSIGKGYAGTIKRHHFNSGRTSHGTRARIACPARLGNVRIQGVCSAENA